MDLWLRLVLAVLATWRVTHMLAREDGPGEVFARLRGGLGESWLGRTLACFYCLSVWVAAPLAGFVTLDPLGWLVSWLAVSGGACLFERFAPEPLVIQPLTQTEEGDADDGMLWSGPTRTEDRIRAADGSAGAAPRNEQRGPTARG